MKLIRLSSTNKMEVDDNQRSSLEKFDVDIFKWISRVNIYYVTSSFIINTIESGYIKSNQSYCDSRLFPKAILCH